MEIIIGLVIVAAIVYLVFRKQPVAYDGKDEGVTLTAVPPVVEEIAKAAEVVEAPKAKAPAKAKKAPAKKPTTKKAPAKKTAAKKPAAKKAPAKK